VCFFCCCFLFQFSGANFFFANVQVNYEGALNGKRVSIAKHVAHVGTLGSVECGFFVL